jgi:hypothetical protein
VKGKRFSPKVTDESAIPVAVLKNSEFIDGEFIFHVDDLNRGNAAGLVRGVVRGVTISGYVAFVAREEDGRLSASLSRFDKLKATNPGGDEILLCTRDTDEAGRSAKLTIVAVGTSIDLYVNDVFVCGIDDAMALGGTVDLLESFPDDKRNASFKGLRIETP